MPPRMPQWLELKLRTVKLMLNRADEQVRYADQAGNGEANMWAESSRPRSSPPQLKPLGLNYGPRLPLSGGTLFGVKIKPLDRTVVAAPRGTRT